METDAVSGIFLWTPQEWRRDCFTRRIFAFDMPRFIPMESRWPPLRSIRTTCDPTSRCFRCRERIFRKLPKAIPSIRYPTGFPARSGESYFKALAWAAMRAGRFAGLGPCAIQQLDLDSGDLEELVSETDRDLLQPRQSEDGSLYYIRKPYESGMPDGQPARFFEGRRDCFPSAWRAPCFNTSTSFR